MRPRSLLLSAVLCALIVLLVPSTASADLTGFIGVTTTPANRPAKGFAIGTGLVIVGMEFEYAGTNEDLIEQAPSLRTFMFNGLLQTPIPIAGMQFYGTAGGGIYRETLSTAVDPSKTNFGINLGGGAKIKLLGPLRLRLDYRVFTLKGSPRHTTVQRFYAGINLKF
jgi:opacity protein-like surface antigen